MHQYRSEIDGLRALAVIPVILFHFNVSGFHGGFIGVDIFFVISGYLITSLIMKALNSGDFSFINFYERRARRLFPAALVVTLFCCIAGWFLLAPNDFKSFGKSLWTFALFGSNIHFMQETGYFDIPSMVKPLLHTWSLSVEEQYYLLIPGLLFLLHKYLKRYIPQLLCLLLVSSLIISAYKVRYDPEFAFYMLPSRAWELLLGSILAISLIPAIKNRILSECLAILGLLLIIGAFVLYNKDTPFPGFAALLPCMGAFLIIWTNSEEKNLIGKTLSTRPLVITGLISYPLYLWHWPLTVFSRYYLDRELLPAEIILLIALTIILSWLTWKYVEQPVRTRRIIAHPGIILSGATACGISFIAFGLAAFHLKGIPERLPEPARSYAAAVWDQPEHSNKCHRMSPQRVKQFDLCVLGEANKPTPDFLVWGDSHANMLLPLFRKLAKDHKLYGVQATYPVCPPILRRTTDQSEPKEECIQFNRMMFKIIKEKGIKNIILSGYWSFYTGKHFKSTIPETLKALKGRNIWVFTDVPNHTVRIPSALAKATLYGRDILSLARTRVHYVKEQEAIKKAFRKNIKSPYKFVDASELLCGAPLKHCRILADGKPLYSDDHHLSTHGALWIESAFKPAFTSISADKNSTASIK